ncbi:MAG: hypothetical protein HOC74_39555 [Gemmatimonadetes bacterium]|jgi:hypothetical protein|nr:hypothetical protein [Gemmatimonadota bacterium]
MKASRVKKKVAGNGGLHLNGLPFREGELVEVIILSREEEQNQNPRSPLRGKVIQYIDPTESVAQDDWEVLK